MPKQSAEYARAANVPGLARRVGILVAQRYAIGRQGQSDYLCISANTGKKRLKLCAHTGPPIPLGQGFAEQVSVTDEIDTVEPSRIKPA